MLAFLGFLCALIVSTFLFITLFLHQAGAGERPVVDKSFHGIAFGQEVFSLGYPIVLNASSLWTYDLDNPSAARSLLTDFHIMPYQVDPAPVCYTKRAKAIAVCETETRRQYYLPTATELDQFSSCEFGSCVSYMELPLHRHPLIALGEVNASLQS